MLTRDVYSAVPRRYRISKHVRVIGIDFRVDGIFLSSRSTAPVCFLHFYPVYLMLRWGFAGNDACETRGGSIFRCAAALSPLLWMDTRLRKGWSQELSYLTVRTPGAEFYSHDHPELPIKNLLLTGFDKSETFLFAVGCGAATFPNRRWKII